MADLDMILTSKRSDWFDDSSSFASVGALESCSLALAPFQRLITRTFVGGQVRLNRPGPLLELALSEHRNERRNARGVGRHVDGIARSQAAADKLIV
jgi:hypothetical protein